MWAIYKFSCSPNKYHLNTINYPQLESPVQMVTASSSPTLHPARSSRTSGHPQLRPLPSPAPSHTPIPHPDQNGRARHDKPPFQPPTAQRLLGIAIALRHEPRGASRSLHGSFMVVPCQVEPTKQLPTTARRSNGEEARSRLMSGMVSEKEGGTRGIWVHETCELLLAVQ